MEILRGFEFDDDNKIQGDYVSAIREAFDKKEGGIAMKFVAFQLKIAETAGKDAALRLESSFDEKECIEQNRTFLFENLTGVKDIKVLVNTTMEAKKYDGSQGQREAAAPGKPAVFFHNADQVFLTEEQVAAQDAAKQEANKKAKKGGKPEEQKQGEKQGKKGKGADPKGKAGPEKERTYIMIKPDGVQRAFIGQIVQKFEQRGFKLVAMKLC